MFFAAPSEITPRDYERPIPPLPWRGIAVLVVLIVIAAASAWEFYVRSLGYGPTLNDNEDLWTQRRRAVTPESVVIIGDSRGWFDLDLDELQKGLGKRPVQLAAGGTCGFPVLADLAKDEAFHGTIICSLVPRLFFAPPGSPPMVRGEKVVRRFHMQTLAQRASQYLAIPLEEHVAFLKQEELTLDDLLKRLPISDRPGALISPSRPPYFGTTDRERRARMIESCARPGKLQDRVKYGWLPLFTPPPPPAYIPREVFMAKMKEATENRFRDITAAVSKLRARGSKIVFVRLPVVSQLKALEDRLTPRAQIWEPLLQRTAAPGIYFEDFPELASFDCPEWSHLSAGDSVEFSKRLVPHLRAALQQ
ncbi:MAG: hypothetical protein ABJB09_07920 [Verrucomicrobiota bacterium]